MKPRPEAAVVERTPRPRTRASLLADLRGLGVEPGMTLLVHSALGRIGWVAGGPAAVVQALLDALGGGGTLVMPAFTDDISDPADWRDPPIPRDWIEAVRDALPLFDPARSPTRDMGRIAELFRTWPGVKRSTHPQASFAAWGRHAEAVVESHPLAWPLGEDSPLRRIYDLDGHVLLLGVGHDRNSSLHFAEGRARRPRKVERRVPIRRAGKRAWITIPDVADDHGRLFPALGADFEATGTPRIGAVGSAASRLMRHRELVDFAVAWFDRALDGPGARP